MTDDNHSMCHFYCNFSVFPHIITVSPDITDIFASQIQTYGRHIRSCFEFLQKVFLGLMCSFSCVLWAIFWSFPLLFFVR